MNECLGTSRAFHGQHSTPMHVLHSLPVLAASDKPLIPHLLQAGRCTAAMKRLTAA